MSRKSKEKEKEKEKWGCTVVRQRGVLFLIRGPQRFVEEDPCLSADLGTQSSAKYCGAIPLLGLTLLCFISGGSRTETEFPLNSY